ncbi:hypothetical protein Tco_1015496 [Tanacetum coccineum]|uniref:Uncharacterized protein n=1 Tax=Tanacetum coccineum TaxID=301880 RepID=A0ABQ5FL18_9ASTR
MAEPILYDNLEKAPTESNLFITRNDINIELSKEFLVELKKNIYYGTYNEDVVDNIVNVLKMVDLIYVPGVDSHQLRIKVFPLLLGRDAFYPESYDGEDEMLDEGENWGIDPLEFLSNINTSFKYHKKVDGRTQKESKYENQSNTATDSFFKAYEVHDIEKQCQTKRKYCNTSNSIKELPNKRRCKAEKFEANQYSLGPNEQYIAIRSYEYDIWERRPRERNVDEITILKTNTPYPSRKIRRIRACTHQRPQRNKDQYAVSRENQYAVFKIWNQYNILEDIKRGPYSKKSPIRRIQHLDTPAKVIVNQESVGSHVPRVILFGAIPVIPKVPIIPVDPLVALEVGAVSVTSPARVLDLVDYSSSASDPSEDSSPLAPEIPLVPPFLYFYDSEADSESEPTQQRPERHESFAIDDVMFPVTPVVAPPRICRRPMILIRPGEAILFGRPYRTYPNRLRKLLTARKRTDRHSSPDFTSDSSSFDSSLDSLSDTSLGSPSDSLSDTSLIHSSGCDTSGQTHSGSSTRVASPRLVYPPVMTLRYSEAFRHCRSAPLSTPYLPMTSESSPYSSSERSLDSSSPSTGPSRKRCRSPTIAIPSSTLVLRSIAPTHVDILPPPKRF